MPAIAAAQTIRGGPGDAPIYRLLRVVHVSFVGTRLARAAGELLGKTSLTDVADALIMAEALRSRPAVLMTSDPGDMSILAAGQGGITILTV